METELTSLCQSVLEDFNLVMFYLPPPTHGGAHHTPSEEEEEQQQHSDSSYPVLPDNLIFKMVVTCLMVVHSLKRGGRWLCNLSCSKEFICSFIFHYVTTSEQKVFSTSSMNQSTCDVFVPKMKFRPWAFVVKTDHFQFVLVIKALNYLEL